MLQLMHLEHHATNVTETRRLFERVSQWIDERKEPHRDNILAKILADASDNELSTTVEQSTALAFAAMVENLAAGQGEDPIASAAADLARAIRKLAEEHEVLHLVLV